MARVSKRDKAEAIETLQKLLPPGSTVYTILRHVSRSGMQRDIDLYRFEGGEKIYLSYYVANALGYSRANGGALKVPGCGMDMGFHLVNSLSYALHGMKDVNCEEDGAPSPAFSTPDRYQAGYSLRHEWL